MKKLDGRKIGHKALEEIRIRAVLQVQSGKSPEDVIDAIGMSRSCIYAWLSDYRNGGLDALKAKKLEGRPPKLGPQDLKWIYHTIVQGNPKQYRFEFALWTLGMVKDLIASRLKVNLSTSSVWRLLRQLGLSCQKPLFRAMQQNPKAVQQWINKTYPQIKSLAKREGARIFFGDEAGVRSDFHAGTTWAVKGETPIVEANGQRFGFNMLSAISTKGEMRFMVVEGSINANVFIQFLRRLIDGVDYKIFLIVDGHRVHHSRKVKEFVTSTNGKLGLFYLPGYSPELNPDEFVWNDLKNNIIGRKLLASKSELKKIIHGGLRKLQRNPQKIRSFFLAPFTKYAA